MLKQRSIEWVEILRHPIEDIGRMLDDEIEKDRKRVGRAWRDIVLAFLDQPTQPTGTAFGQGDEWALAADEDDRRQFRPALAESGQQQRRQGRLASDTRTGLEI